MRQCEASTTRQSPMVLSEELMSIQIKLYGWLIAIQFQHSIVLGLIRVLIVRDTGIVICELLWVEGKEWHIHSNYTTGKCQGWKQFWNSKIAPRSPPMCKIQTQLAVVVKNGFEQESPHSVKNLNLSGFWWTISGSIVLISLKMHIVVLICFKDSNKKTSSEQQFCK